MQTQIQASTAREDEKVARVINRVLTQVFGEEATNLIYKHLERNHAVKRNEVVEKIDEFAKGLEEFLSSGAYVIERKILEDIYSSYGLLRRLEEEASVNYDFVGQMRSIMQQS